MRVLDEPLSRLVIAPIPLERMRVPFVVLWNGDLQVLEKLKPPNRRRQQLPAAILRLTPTKSW